MEDKPRTQRLDLHNADVDETVASMNLCGRKDLKTGRVCSLPARHRGCCQLIYFEQQP